ncbi:hypothetical protein PGTUg99_025268 [Puccinia graminis f. sp. tritici]|uniref:Uncharacterized protein n=1 Tax=Puccinia graminis f. sp. tritici TaxID=56615 RepID=A0A5B0RTV0_PUCGR|nr:hypothetical protein PGTUg99_025268 [Puccinia graminis f. sp. tritici]
MRTRSAKHTQTTLNQNRKSTVRSSRKKTARVKSKVGTGQSQASKTKSSRKRPRISTNSNSDSSSDSTSEDEPENPTSSETEQANPTSKNQHTSNRPPQDEEVGFDLDNFESHLESWSLSELRATLQKKKHGTSNRISPEVQERLELLQQNYMKSKLMLALIGNVAEKTVTKFLGENKPPRRKSGWNRFAAFSLESLKYPVPPKGASEGWEERNIEIGKAWKLLDVDEKAVFSARIFQHFSGIPCNFEDEPEDDEEESDLTTDEIELYKPLYDKLVNIEKVNIVAAKGSECQGENTSQTYKKALSATLKLNSELYTISNVYNTTYYLLTATRSPGKNSFCKEYSNDAAWLALAKKKWSAKETFEAYSHAREIQGDLEKIVGGSAGQKQQKDSDLVKIKLRQALNDLLS